MAVPHRKITIVVGPVGCGKSSLLKAILGEMPFCEGTVYATAASIAYCEQTAWHMNGTIQESIVGPQSFDRTWYDKVVHCCGLEQDFSQLPLADQSLIGSKGIALSGGQSQRVALARAVYAKKSVLVLDDALSGLDFDTENHVFHSLLGVDGILRKAGVTVLIASSSTKRVPYADQIVSLDANGKICEQGTFEDLRRSGGYVSSFDIKSADWAFEPRALDSDSKRGNKGSDIMQKTPLGSESLDDESRRTGDVRIYLYYIGAVGWPAAIVFLIGISGFVFCFSFPNIWVKWWAQANADAPNENLGYWLGIYGALGALALICLVGACWQMIITMIPLSGKSFHTTLLKTVLNAPMSFFSTTDTGVTINRFSQDLMLIDMELPLAALNTCAALILCLANMVLIGVASSYAAISFPICIFAIYMVQKFYLHTSRQLRFLDIEAKSPLYSQFSEVISGLATIRAFGWQSALRKLNRMLLDRSQRPFYLLFAVQRWLTLVLDLIVAAIAVLLVVLVIALRGTISAGFVGVALLNVILFSQQIKILVQYWTQLETHIGAIARIKSFSAETDPEHSSDESQMPPAQWPSEGAIEIESISAAYKHGENVLNNVSMSIEAGQKVAICGRTGSGKSSLTLALFQMILRTGGEIFIDSIPISKIPRNILRSRLNGVPQDPFTFAGSVRRNADPLELASESAIIEALDSVQLWSKIKEKGGLEADMDKLHFSQGQRQLFCLARALVRPGKVVVLDEVTSSIDGKTDAVLQRVLREKFSSHTVISVSHRLDTVLDYDKIALMDGGKLVEFDSPHTLLAQEDSAFRRLYYSANGSEDSMSGSEKISNLDADEISRNVYKSSREKFVNSVRRSRAVFWQSL